MKYISMLNPYSFKYLWESKEGKDYILKILHYYLNNKEDYKLLNYFNDNFNNVRSYLIFESNTSIVLIDFNLKHRNIDDDIAILSILEATTYKRLYFILLNNFKGKTSFNNNIWNIFKNDSFIFAETYEKQISIDKELTKHLYKMPKETYKLYLHEEELLNK